MPYNKTFAMIKPDAVQRGLIGEIIKRFEQKGLTIIGIKMINVSDNQAKQHYLPLSDKPFYKELVKYITSSPVVVLCIAGHRACELVRLMSGSTNPLDSIPGTIRGDFSSDLENNVIHTSDSISSAQREISIYFNESELLNYHKLLEKWSSSQKD